MPLLWAVLLQSNYTREHSEATQALLRGFVGDIVEGVASSRGLPEAEVHPLPDLPAAMWSNQVIKADDGMTTKWFWLLYTLHGITA